VFGENRQVIYSIYLRVRPIISVILALKEKSASIY